MSFKGDLDIWREFAQDLKKLDKSHERYVYLPASPPRSPTSRRKYNNNELIALKNNISPMGHVSVEILPRAAIKKFRAQRSIDLHGYTREIDKTLENFCARCIVDGIREVFIITGKGQGIVKTATQQWVRSHPEFVIGFFEVRDSVGESGAYGVRLRRK